MVRRRRSRSVYSRRPVKSVKYSNETTALNLTQTVPADQPKSLEAVVISPLNSQGTRKVKNFTLSLATNFEFGVYFALVYVPQGTEAPDFVVVRNEIKSLYEPNQNVIMSGIFNHSSPIRIRSRLARNLNSGDSVSLLLFVESLNQQHELVVQGNLNYAICY